MPKISVFSPTYNHGKYLRRNIESILNQTFTDFEFIIVNDGSTDDTDEICMEYAKSDSRIKYHYFKENKGVQEAFEYGFKLTQGELIYPTASDDYVTHCLFFDEVVEALDKNPLACGAFGTANIHHSETGKKIGTAGMLNRSNQHCPPAEFIGQFLTHKALVPGVSAIFKKDLILKIGGYPSKLGPQHDYFINHALGCLHGIVFIPYVVAYHSYNPEGYNNSTNLHQKIENYAGVEKQLRALEFPVKVDPKLFDYWREIMVSNLLIEDINKNLPKRKKEIFDQFGAICNTVQSTPEHFA